MDYTDKSQNEFIASQQNLFAENNVANDKQEKMIEENKLDDPFFMQFDFFDQNIRAVKKQSDSSVEKVQVYENKFKSFNNSESEIEPNHGLDISKLKDENKITREKTSKHPKRVEVSLNLLESVESKESSMSERDNFDNKINFKQSEDTNKLEEKINEKNEVEQDFPSNEVKENSVTVLENDYKATIGKLYSDSKHQDPYEVNKIKSFKEIFPHSQVSETKNSDNSSQIDKLIANSEDSNISCEDIKTLNNLYNLQGVNIKSHAPIKSQEDKIYTDKSKLNMFSILLTSFIMFIEVVLTYIFIRNSGKLIPSHSIVYFIAGSISLALAIISILENFFDRYKLVIIKSNFKKEFTTRLLIFIIFSIIVLAVCLAFGMKSLEDKYFISLWLIPTLSASNIVVFYLIKYLFVRQKYFSS